MTAKEKPVRVQLKRTKGWKMPENTVKVDRTTRYGNPFAPGVLVRFKNGSLVVQDVEQSARLFAQFGPRYLERRGVTIAALRGKNLACWCKPDQPCHADVLLELANAPIALAQPLEPKD